MNVPHTDDAADLYGDRDYYAYVADPAHPVLENDHGPTCNPGGVCVNCGGCGCGFAPRTCADNPVADTGCYSIAQAEAEAHHADMMAECEDPDYGRDLDDDDCEGCEDCDGWSDDRFDDEFDDEHPYGEG